VAREYRKLAAILVADVVGYSRMMGRDESGTLALLKAHRKERFEPTLARHGGRVVKLTGDGPWPSSLAPLTPSRPPSSSSRPFLRPTVTNPKIVA